MANFWLVKTEPSDYSFDDLLRDKATVWSGVSNSLALKHMRAMRQGDLTFIYHTGDEKAVVGVAEISSDPYPDPGADNPNLVVVDLKAKQRLAKSVSLVRIKSDKRFAQFELVRIGRLSVMPVSKPIWNALLKMAR